MAIFEIQGDDGTVFEVEAGSLEQAAAAVQAMGTPQKSWGQVLKENLFGDNDPNTQNLGEKIGSTLNKAGEALTFGLVGDETSAAVESLMPGVGYADRRDHYRQQEEVLERDNPGLALGAEIGGGLVGAAVPVLGTMGTLGRGASMGARVAASGAAGAGMGGTYGAMEGEGLQGRVDGLKTGVGVGGLVGAAVPVVGAGVQRLANNRAANKAIREAVDGAPTTEALRAEGRGLYQQVEDAGVSLRADKVRELMDGIGGSIRDEGLRFSSVKPQMPASAAALGVADDVAGEVGNTLSFKDFDVARRAVGNAAGSNLANRNDTRVATEALTGINDFVRNLTPDQVDAGDVEALKTALPKAQGVWSRMSRSQLLDDAIDNAQDYRSGEASGIKAQFQRIVKNPKLRQGFSEAEIRAMRRVVNGTLPEQILGYAGSGLGMVAQSAVGGLMGGIPGLIAGAATGGAARKAAEAVTRKNAEVARALVAAGGVPQLPVATDNARRFIETLIRRNAAVGPQ